jgi:hypothetical protein
MFNKNPILNKKNKKTKIMKKKVTIKELLLFNRAV